MSAVHRAALVAALLVLAALVGPHRAEAQVPISGYDLCAGDCAVPVDNVAARVALTAFKFPVWPPTAASVSDVMIADQNVGGSSPCGAEVNAVGWLVPANWLVPQLGAHQVVVILASPSWVAWDSGSIAATMGDFGLVNGLQVPGALAGRLSPDVEPVPGGGARVRWTPLRERGPDPSGAGCATAGETLVGVVQGYNVYRLRIADHPAPSLRDFVLYGHLGYADLSSLAFNVPDPDGNSGSDLDRRDELTLVNPDGLPSTGDEILVWTDDAGAPPDYWYRIQPVAWGRLDTTEACSTRELVAAVDLDGDTLGDSLDFHADGRLDFIDPSRHGFGLAYDGEILSSPFPGVLGSTPGAPGCDGEPALLPAESNCGNRVDDDGDTLVDCADDDCLGSPGCGTPSTELSCTNGADDDGDTLVDCEDPDCADAPGCAPPDPDPDRDGVPTPDDCAPLDGTAFAVPGEVLLLHARRAGATDALLEWDDLAPSSGSGAAYDVVGDLLSGLGLPGVRDPARRRCDFAVPSWLDTERPPLRDVDPDPIAERLVPDGFYYIVRAGNACGEGPWGRDSLGGAHVAGCP